MDRPYTDIVCNTVCGWCDELERLTRPAADCFTLESESIRAHIERTDQIRKHVQQRVLRIASQMETGDAC